MYRVSDAASTREPARGLHVDLLLRLGTAVDGRVTGLPLVVVCHLARWDGTRPESPNLAKSALSDSQTYIAATQSGLGLVRWSV